MAHTAVIRSHTVIYAGNVIGDDFQTGHGVLIREENEIGDNASIGSHTKLWSITSRLQTMCVCTPNVFVPEFSILEEGCG